MSNNGERKEKTGNKELKPKFGEKRVKGSVRSEINNVTRK